MSDERHGHWNEEALRKWIRSDRAYLIEREEPTQETE